MGYVAPDMTTPAAVYRIARLGAGDDAMATALFETMAAVFEEDLEDAEDPSEMDEAAQPA